MDSEEQFEIPVDFCSLGKSLIAIGFTPNFVSDFLHKSAKVLSHMKFESILTDLIDLVDFENNNNVFTNETWKQITDFKITVEKEDFPYDVKTWFYDRGLSISYPAPLLYPKNTTLNTCFTSRFARKTLPSVLTNYEDLNYSILLQIKIENNLPLWFHGCNQNQAYSLLQRGVELHSFRRGEQDFGLKNSFYVVNSFHHALQWAKFHQGSVFVFQFSHEDLLRYEPHLDFHSADPNFREIVCLSRIPDPSISEAEALDTFEVDDKKWIKGPIFRPPYLSPLEGVFQIAIKHRDLCKFLNESCVGVVFFQ